MKLEINSKILLDITRAKSKLYEFGIEEEYHLPLTDNPKKLLIFTIGILGELAALEARPADIRDGYRAELKEQLVLVGQYFDALSTSRLTPEIDTYLKMLGSASYYLADMPGSSLVLAKLLSDQPEQLSDGYLESFLIWLLKADVASVWYYLEGAPFNGELFEVLTIYKRFWARDVQFRDVEIVAKKLRDKVYESGSDRELLLIDTIVSVMLRRISNSSIICLPKYTGLPSDAWGTALNGAQFVKEFWPAQRLLGERGVLRGISAVVQMPTSAGKTKSAELIIRSSFLSGRSKLAVVIAPFRALCREISKNFERAFEGDSISVNELRDVTNVDEAEDSFMKFLLGDSFKGGKEYTVLVSTPEKMVYLLRHEPMLSSKIGLLIFDEGHQFDSGNRGVTYELLIASLKATVQFDAQKVLISAVMANAETIGEWLNGERGISIQGSKWLPSLKSVAFFSWRTEMGQLSYLSLDSFNDSGLYVPRIVQQINLGKRGRERSDRLFPDKAKPQTISTYLGLKLSAQGPVALFCGDKRSITSISKMLIEYYSRGLNLPAPRLSSDGEELDKIAFLATLHFGSEHVLPKAISMGLLPHSANIPNGIRIAVEWAMVNDKGSFVVCTSTLAQGVNLPIKYLIVSSTMQGGKKISTRDFQNLIGRAGRSGYHTEGSIIFADPKLYDERFTKSGKFRWAEALELLDFNNAEDCLSSLKELIKPFSAAYAIDHLMAFLSNPAQHRKDWVNWAAQSGNDISILLDEMDEKQQVINSIESYFLSVLKDDPKLLKENGVINLLHQTLAYHLANITERLALENIFKLLSERLFGLEEYKFSYYGKTLLGLDQLQYIDSWVDSASFELGLAETSNDLLDLLWGIIQLFARRKIIMNIQPPELVVELSKLWMAGNSYHELLAHAKRSGGSCQAKTKILHITLDHIMDLTASLAYDGMLIVGGVADILEGRGFDEDRVSLVRSLQNMLKLGMSSEFQMWLYSKGFTDREVCRVLQKKIEDAGINTDILDFNILKNNHELVSEVLSALPTVFSDVLIK